jgi:hypothetical protein
MDEFDELDLNEEIGGDDWLNNYEESLNSSEEKDFTLSEDAIDGSISSNPELGEANIADLMTGRFSHMSAGVNEAARHITNSTVPDYMGFDALTILAAGDRFTNTIGRDAAAWGRALPSTEGKLGGVVTRLDPITMKPISSYQPDIGRQDYAMALSMLTQSAEEYLVKGSGESLVGHSLIGEKNDKADSDFEKANKISLEIAALYMREGTKGSEVESARLASIQNDVIKRMVSSSGVTALGLPNELSTNGLVTTQTYSGRGQGTSLTAEDHLLEYSGYTVKNSKGFQELVVGAPEDVVKAYWRRKGSVKDSLFPLPKSTEASPISDEIQDNNKKLQEIKYRQLEKDAKFARSVFRLTLTGETKGRKSMILDDRTHGLQAEDSYLRDDAAILDLDYTAGDDLAKGRTMPNSSTESTDVKAVATKLEGSEKDGYHSAETNNSSPLTRKEGSDKSGLYGAKETSESQDYVAKGVTLAELIAEEEAENKYQFGPIPMTEREAYLRETSTSESASQGGDDWLKEREGHVTASMFTNTTKKYKTQDLAIALASERLGIKSFVGNSDTREGNDSEDKALRSLLAHFNHGKSKEDYKTIEEAFFVKGEEGMGASVDGRMFNADGSSAGNVELKYLSTNSIKGARKKYEEQMQFQMAVTGSNQTHFGVLNKDTNQFHYELVKADAKVQGQLIGKARKALEVQGSYRAMDIDNMRKKRGRQPTQPLDTTTGQTEAYKEEVEKVEKAMTAFSTEVKYATNYDAKTDSVRKEPVAKGEEFVDGEVLQDPVSDLENPSKLDKAIIAELKKANDLAQSKAKNSVAYSAGYGPTALDAIDQKTVDHGYAEEERSTKKSLKNANERASNKAKDAQFLSAGYKLTALDALDQKTVDHGYAEEERSTKKSLKNANERASNKAKDAQFLSAGYKLTALDALDAKPVNHGYKDEEKQAVKESKDRVTSAHVKAKDSRMMSAGHRSTVFDDMEAKPVDHGYVDEYKKIEKELKAKDKLSENEATASGKIEVDAARVKAKDAQYSSKGHRPTAFDNIDDKPVDHGYSDEIKELATAAKDSSQALKGFEDALGKIGKVAVELAERLLAGNEEGMDVVRLAASVGLDEDTTLGVRDHLARKGLGQQGAVSVLRSAATQTEKLNNPIIGSKEYARMSIAATATGSGLKIPSELVTTQMDTKDYLVMANKQADEAGLEGLQRSDAMKNVFNLNGFEVYDGTPEEIDTATKSVEEEKLRLAAEAIEKVRQDKLNAQRALGSVSPEVAAAAYITKELSGSSTAGLAGNALAVGAGILGAKALPSVLGAAKGAVTGSGAAAIKGAGKAKDLLSKAKLPAGSSSKLLSLAASGGKTLLKGLARATPVGFAAWGAYEAASYAYDNLLDEDTKDSVSDSIDGVVSSGMSYFEEDEDLAFPTKGIGEIAANTVSDKASTLNSNVSVNVSVNPDLVTTKVDDNGFITIDSDSIGGNV